MNKEDLEKLKELKTKQTLEKLKVKYEAKLIKHGYYFLDVVNYNNRYVFLEYKNMKGPEKLLFSIVRIWKDLQSGKMEADLLIRGDESKDFKHLSIKELFALLDEIEKSGKIPL